MEETTDAGSDRSDSTEREERKYYLPGMPRASADPGRVERFVTDLLRQRGGYEAVVRRVDR